MLQSWCMQPKGSMRIGIICTGTYLSLHCLLSFQQLRYATVTRTYLKTFLTKLGAPHHLSNIPQPEINRRVYLKSNQTSTLLPVSYNLRNGGKDSEFITYSVQTADWSRYTQLANQRKDGGETGLPLHASIVQHSAETTGVLNPKAGSAQWQRVRV
jgi:hypothetical protein